MSVYDEEAVKLHRELKGKVEMVSKVVLSKNNAHLYYTPGVAKPCMVIAGDKSKAWELTMKNNTVAIVSDGTAVLGLGDIGPEGAMPVMEGKAMLFKQLGGVNGVPLCINTKDPEEIIKFVKLISPTFGAINLEDIKAPECYKILNRLEEELDIPVFHDDQDGTAIVTLAGVINACKVLKKEIKNQKVVINGAGAAGISIARLLSSYGIKDILVCDSEGIISNKRKGKMNKYKEELLVFTNKKNIDGGLKEALVGSDIFVGVSKGNLLDEKMIKSMNKSPIILAMANPTPEVMPDVALKAGAGIVGTGRSDFDNQINNALVFPSLFRALLDFRIKNVTKEIKIAAALAIANSVKNPTKDKIIPNLFEEEYRKNIIKEIEKLK